MRKTSFAFVASVALLLLANAYASEPDAILGHWLTEGDESVVEIYKAGESYSGKIIWLKKPHNSDGSEKIDSNNPDKSKATRKIIGMDIVSGFKHEGKGAWSGGQIYDPNNGKTYSCSAKLVKGKLNIRGFIGVSLLGRTVVWTKKPVTTAGEHAPDASSLAPVSATSAE